MLHSKIVGSSTASRRLACPGSIDLEVQIPEPPESIYAAEGTGLHEAMEFILNHDLQPGDVAGRLFYGIEMTPERIELLQFCIDIFEAIATPDRAFEVEKTLPFPAVEGAFGTGDVLVFNDNRSRFDLLDWKFGAGVPVYTPGNSQMKFLLSAARAAYPDEITPSTRMFATIVQPRLDYAESAEFTHDELDSFETDLKHALNVRRFGENNLSVGDHCRFCKAAAVCPARMALARSAFAWDALTQERLPQALAMVDTVEEWVKDVRELAHRALTAGSEIQGWKLVQKRGSREWNEQDPVKLEKLLYRKLGLLRDQRFNSKLISPAQAEKLVGKKAVEGLAQMTEGNGTTLAREGDKRPAVNVPGRSLNLLATAIKTGTIETKTET
jgi:hypothetical protein